MWFALASLDTVLEVATALLTGDETLKSQRNWCFGGGELLGSSLELVDLKEISIASHRAKTCYAYF